jgi:hypothetical protein
VPTKQDRIKRDEAPSGADGLILERPAAIVTIIGGGLAAAVGDGLFAIIFYGMILGVNQLRIFQGVASGLLGRPAYAGGLTTYFLGLGLHLVVGVCIATVYFLLSSKWSFPIKRPVVCGLIYGVLAYLVMNYVVIPLSAARHGAFHLSYFLIEIVGHAVLVGLPIALIARRSATWMIWSAGSRGADGSTRCVTLRRLAGTRRQRISRPRG